MTKAIRFSTPGGPEVLEWTDVDVGDPGPGQVRIRHTAVGLNFVDVYHRSGLYPVPLPSGLGLEGAGVIEAVGEGVDDMAEGDRVAYSNAGIGSYAEVRIAPADRLVPLPDAIDDTTAAAIMLKGLTAHYLLHRTFPVEAGQTILIHAAAGGVGQLACQWARHLGVTVIGTAGSEEKAKIARAAGCQHVILYRQEKVPDRVREITGGKGVPVVYDSVGKDTFSDSLDCLSMRGMMVSYGNASGPVPAIEPNELSTRGSLFLTRPTLLHYVMERAELLANAAELFEVIASGAVKASIGQTYPLAEAGRAQADLEARKTTGSTLLMP